MGRNECVPYYSDVCVGDCAFNPISGGKTQVDLCEFKATVRPEREKESWGWKEWIYGIGHRNEKSSCTPSGTH